MRPFSKRISPHTQCQPQTHGLDFKLLEIDMPQDQRSGTIRPYIITATTTTKPTITIITTIITIIIISICGSNRVRNNDTHSIGSVLSPPCHYLHK